MNLEQFLSILSALLGALGSIYVLRNILHLTPDKIEQISASKRGHNPDQIDSLSEQKAENFIGSLLIIFALLIGFLNVIFSPSNITTFSNKFLAILIAISISCVIYFFMVKISKLVEKNTHEAVAKILISEKLDKLFKRIKVPKFEFSSLCFISNRFLELNQRKDESDIEYLHRIAKVADRKLPTDIEIVENKKQ